MWKRDKKLDEDWDEESPKMYQTKTAQNDSGVKDGSSSGRKLTHGHHSDQISRSSFGVTKNKHNMIWWLILAEL